MVRISSSSLIRGKCRLFFPEEHQLSGWAEKTGKQCFLQNVHCISQCSSNYTKFSRVIQNSVLENIKSRRIGSFLGFSAKIRYDPHWHWNRFSKFSAPTILPLRNPRKEQLQEIIAADIYLTAKRAEAEGIEKAALADLAGVGDAFPWPRLWPLVQENDPGAVDNVGLDSTYVQHLLYLRHPYHIMVRRPPYL